MRSAPARPSEGNAVKVKMRVHITGTRNGAHWPEPGGVIDLPDNEAADMCAQGYAEPVAQKSRDKTETRTSKDEVACPVEGCDYTGTERGLKIHAHSHEDE